MFYQNVNGLKTKLTDFLCAALAEEYSIIALTETGLDPNINDAELLDHSYAVYRNDRSLMNSSKSARGGVLLAVKNNFKSCRLSIGDPSVEEVWISITVGTSVYCIGCVYIPPSMDVSVYESHFSSASSTCDVFQRVLVLGDYNLSHITWSPGNDHVGLLPGNVKSVKETLLCDTITFLGLSQFNSVINDYNAILDLCLANFDLPSCVKTNGLVTCDPYHPPLELSIDSGYVKYLDPADYSYYDFKNVNYDLLNNYFQSFNWLSIMHEDIDITLNNFYTVIYNSFEMFVPLKHSLSSNRFPIWFSSELKNLIFQKKLAHKNYKRSNNVNTYNTFSLLRRQCRVLTDDCYRRYISNAESAINENPNYFWNYIRSKRNRGVIPKIMHLDTDTADHGRGIADLFARFFSSVFNPHTSTNHCHNISDKFVAISDIYILVLTIFKNLA